MDLAFVVDASGNTDPNDVLTRNNWRAVLTFVNAIIGQFSIGPDQTHVAFVKFSTFANVEFPLNSFYSFDVVNLQNVVSAIQYTGGLTNTAGALQLLISSVFVAGSGDRPGFPNLAFLITRSQSNVIADQTIPAAVAAKQNGIRIIVIGITNLVNADELRGIASTFIDVYYANAFADLGNFTNGVVGRSCPPGGVFYYYLPCKTTGTVKSKSH